MFWEVLIYISIYLGLFVSIFYALNLFSKRKEKDPSFQEGKNVKVSIIIPAYNESKGIAATIKSALNLDYPKHLLEIIVVDDGSKDNTYEVASRFKKYGVRVFKCAVNRGKGGAMNFGLSKSKGEFVFTMDADETSVKSGSVKKMIAYFNNPEVMCVAPIMLIRNPRGLLQRIQAAEYLLGVFLRKAFASLNAIHVTPGAFSVYRKSFFDRYGGFETNNLTEDLEMALRIQSHHYIIQNCTEAIVHTNAPRKFKELLIQRRRWYVGLLKNLAKYYYMFSKKYGVLGTVILPIAMMSVFFSVVLTGYIVITTLINLKNEFVFLESVNFSFLGAYEFSRFTLERVLLSFFTNPLMLFFILLGFILAGYMIFAKSKIKQNANIFGSLPIFMLFYAFFFAFWWVVSLSYFFFNRAVKW